MPPIARHWLLSVIATCWPIVAPAADHYFAYSYQGIDVVTVGNADSAVALAHNLHRLDAAITAVLGAKAGSWRPPTEVYAIYSPTFARVRGVKDDAGTQFSPTPFRNTVLINASESAEERMWGAYFGYTGSVLVSAYSMRYPEWFIKGLSLVFEASKLDRESVVIGEIRSSRASWLYARPLFPVKLLLRSRGSDPQYQGAEAAAVRDAECWLLVHLIVIDQKFHDNFYKYFRLLDQGEAEDKAFAASFDISYEDLDKMLQGALKAGKIRSLRVGIADQADATQPVRLSDSDAAARLALVASRHSRDLDDALKMANEALSADPKSEPALMALAGVEFKLQDYAAAREATDRLCSAEQLSPAGVARCGELYRYLVDAVLGKKVALDVEVSTLADRSRGYLERAIATDPDDLASWHGLAFLTVSTKDLAYAKTLLPKLEQKVVEHSRSGELARSAAVLSASAGDLDNALKLALIWQANALDATGRSTATTYVARLRAALDRKAAAGQAAAQQ